ncbi:MAG TPA: LacI family DNA-binding transcriptional regulator [Paludibacter sp.]|nr:LacI family DNA-binding transcriptional regulator [Paludibacter sp.]
MKKRITIKDIAKELNVHHSTVSRALRNDPRVNEVTRDAVLAYAREHEYQTNMNAVQLRGTSNNAIALIVPNINHSFFSDIVSQLTNLAYQKGYVISVFQTNEKYQQEKEIVNTIIRHNFAGVIVSIAKDTVNSDHFALLKKFGIPLVFFDRVCEDIDMPKVLINNYEITFSATEYLLGKGYTRIAHLTAPNAINVFRDRQKGYLDALAKHGLVYQNPIEIDEEFTIQVGRDVFSKLWNSPERPDAIISSSIHLTMGILLQARAYGIEIPKELGLITFGTLLSSEIIQPQITYIEQPEKEIAEISFELLEKMMTGEIQEATAIEKVVEAGIVFKESC